MSRQVDRNVAVFDNGLMTTPLEICLGIYTTELSPPTFVGWFGVAMTPRVCQSQRTDVNAPSFIPTFCGTMMRSILGCPLTTISFFADYLYSCESVPATRFHAEHLTQGRMAVETSKHASTSQFSKSRCCKISLRKIDTRPTCRRNQKTTATLHVCVCGHTVGVRPHVHNCCSSYILIATRYFILTTRTPRMSLVVVALNGRAVPKQPFMFWLLRNPPDRPPVA